MAWYAKPSGAYARESDEAHNNIWEIYYLLTAAGYTVECVAGICGNMVSESGLNPWRWQNERVSESLGYGLFQYTPARDYLNKCTDLAGYSPNRSVTSITSGATPQDGKAQVEAFIIDRLAKWTVYVWRDYWSTSEYPALRQRCLRIRREYGNGTTLTQSQFSKIDDVDDAAFAFMACFEGPAAPNFSSRQSNAQYIYTVLQGEPPEPPGPEPTSIPYWLLKKISLGGKFY